MTNGWYCEAAWSRAALDPEYPELVEPKLDEPKFEPDVNPDPKLDPVDPKLVPAEPKLDEPNCEPKLPELPRPNAEPKLDGG